MKLVGRQRERAQVAERLAEGHRIVTLVGPAGVGKTRLVRELFPEAPFCELVDVRSADDVDNVVRSTLEGHALVVLDNVEQLTPEAVLLIASWAKRTKMVTTSRERLALREEGLVAIDPLPLDDAINLLEQVGRASGADVDAMDRALLERIAERLEGLPLSIELAGARLRTLGPERLCALLSKPLELLSRAPRDAPPHHASLERAIGWSWDLLDDSSQQALARLSMLTAPVTEQEAQSVVGGDALEMLERLADKSLVVPHDGCFRMLASVQAFARKRGSRWIDDELRASRAEALFARGRYDESLASLEGAEGSRIDEVRSWVLRRLGRIADARAAGERALAAADRRDQPRIRGSLAAILLEEGDLDAARAAFEEVRDTADDARSQALAGGMIGHVDHELGDLDAAAAAYEGAALGLANAGDERLAAVYAGYRAMVSHERGDDDAADRYRSAIEEAGRHEGHFSGLFHACLGALLASKGDIDAAERAFEAAAASLEACSDPALVHALALHRAWLDPADAPMPVSEATSDDVRFAERLLQRRRGGALAVGDRQVTFAGRAIDLRRRRVLWRVLAALVDTPGETVSRAALIAAGWGDERMQERAAAHRLRVAIHELRRMGLADAIQRTDDGYALTCDVKQI